MASSFSYSGNTSKIIPNFASETPSLYNTNVSLSEVQEPINTASAEVRQIIERVLQTEKDKLYLKTPRNINDDILKIIKEEVQ